MKQIRIASHVHSEWSYDGSWSLTEIAAQFGRRGYDAVLLAEHDRGFHAARWAGYREACVRASRANCVLVPGIEYSDPSNTIHIPVWGDIPFLGEATPTGDLLGRADDLGGLAVLAHPARRGAWERFDSAWLPHLLGMEVWNRKYDGYAPNRAIAEYVGARPELLPFVSLDFHTSRQFHPLTMMLGCAEEITEARICDGMRSRRLQATAFGLPALHLARNPAWPAMCGLERARRRVAHARRDRRLRGSQRADGDRRP